MSDSDRSGDDPRHAVIARLQSSVEAVRSQGDGDADVDDPGAVATGSWASVPGADAPGPDDAEYRRAKSRALNILAARDVSASQMRERLLGREHPPDVVDVLVARLTDSGLLDDRSFAHSYVRSAREGRALSVSALGRELRARGIADEHIEEALAEVDDEFDTAYAVALKKARSTRGLDEQTRMRRILGMLARRGFGQSVGVRAARAAMQDAG